MIKEVDFCKSAAEVAQQAAQQAFDELWDFLELHGETIERYKELTAKYERLAMEASGVRKRKSTKTKTASKTIAMM